MSTAVWVWSAQAVVSAATLVAGHPFTAWLSRRRYPDDVRAHPMFLEANRVMTAAWTGYFAAAAVAARVGGSWASIAFTAPTPILGWLSFRVGDAYARRRIAHDRPPTERGPMAKDAQLELRSQISGKTDDEIVALVGETPGGFEALFDETVAAMPESFDPDAAQDCVVGYEIAEAGRVYDCRIEVCGRKVKAERRTPRDARVVLQLSGPDFLRLITGLLDGTEAFMTGRMRMRGDVMFAPQIGHMFRTA